jgi:hypothetical protein
LIKEAQITDRIDKLRETLFIVRVRLFSLKQELQVLKALESAGLR